MTFWKLISILFTIAKRLMRERKPEERFLPFNFLRFTFCKIPTLLVNECWGFCYS